jgi:hypothetical protein
MVKKECRLKIYEENGRTAIALRYSSSFFNSTLLPKPPQIAALPPRFYTLGFPPAAIFYILQGH